MSRARYQWAARDVGRARDAKVVRTRLSRLSGPRARRSRMAATPPTAAKREVGICLERAAAAFPSRSVQSRRMTAGRAIFSLSIRRARKQRTDRWRTREPIRFRTCIIGRSPTPRLTATVFSVRRVATMRHCGRKSSRFSSSDRQRMGSSNVLRLRRSATPPVQTSRRSSRLPAWSDARSVPTRSRSASGLAAWARCTAPTTASWVVTSRSRSCPRSSPLIRSAAPASLARPALLATLNHPHIGAIYGLEEADGLIALVLELVEGETLAARLERGPLPLSHAITIAAQIADALDAAHEKGIVHRDLKPANIVLQGATDFPSSDLRTKVLDFGVAKLVIGRVEVEATSTGDTREGHIVGTPAYMSPEQARGQAVDARTDVWAFGCVLYEMIVGRSAFRGATASDTIAKILERDPDWQALPPSTPSSIQRLLRRCLEKDPKLRLHAIADVNFDLEEARAESKQQLRTAARSRTRGTWVLAATVIVLASAAAAWQVWSTRSANLPAPRVMPLTSYPGLEASPTFSPDGRQVAFSWDGEKGKQRGHLRGDGRRG